MFQMNFYRKALFRQPVRMFLLIVLLASACFAFTSHAAEALLVAKETDVLEQYYKPIGYLTGNIDVQKGQEIVSECPYLELEDIYQYSAGILTDLENGDVDGGALKYLTYRHTNEVIFIGRFIGSEFVKPEEEKKIDFKAGYYNLCFEVSSVEAAYQDYMLEGDIIYVRSLPGVEEDEVIYFFDQYFPIEQDEVFLEEYSTLKEGNTYLLHAYYSENNLINGSGSARNGRAGDNFILQPLLPEGKGPYFYEVEGEVDYQTSELAGLWDYVEFLRHNYRVMRVVGTKDMSLMPLFQEITKRHSIVEGRMLTGEDDREGRRVCVVHESFAKAKGLQIGDKLRIRLEENVSPSSYYIGYAQWEEWEKWNGCSYQEEELEIVGFFHDIALLSQSVSGYRVGMYVPSSVIQEKQRHHELNGGGNFCYSFVLQKPEDQQRFLEEYSARIEKAGNQVTFVENNVSNFVKTAKKLRTSTVFGTVLFGVVLAAALLAVSGLYLAQRRKEYAVARALGLPAGKASWGMVTSFGWVAVPGIGIGCVLGWRQMLSQARELLQPLEGQVKTGEEVMLSPFWLVGMMAGIFVVLLLVLAGGSLLFQRKPVLSFLQGHAATVKKPVSEKHPGSAKTSGSEGKATVTTGNRTEGGFAPLPSSQAGRIAARFSYIGKHISRTKARALIPFLLGTGVVLLFAWILETMTSYKTEVERLYQTTVVQGEIRKVTSDVVIAKALNGGGEIRASLVSKIEETGLVQETYREETALAEEIYVSGVKGGAVAQGIPLYGIYDWEKFTSGTGEQLKVTFFHGYTWKHFLREREEGDASAWEVVLSEQQIEELGAKAGDVLCLKVNGKITNCILVGSYQQTQEGSSGIIRTLPSSIGLLHGITLHEMAGKNCYHLVAQFTFSPEKNRELLARETELKEIISGDADGAFLRLFIWNEELHEVVEPMERTLSLFQVLYPAAMVVVLVLGLGFQLLLLLQRRKEAAVMRILGSPARMVSGLLGAEQLLLCLVGTAFGLLVGWFQAETLAWGIWLAVGVYVLGNVLGIVIGSVAVARRSPLALLQEKE